jgi:hypothetical protein
MARRLCATFLICLLLSNAGCRHRDGLASGASPLECEFYDYGSERGASDAKTHSYDYRGDFKKDPPMATVYICIGFKEDGYEDKMALKMVDLCGKGDGTEGKAAKAFIAGYTKGYEASL